MNDYGVMRELFDNVYHVSRSDLQIYKQELYIDLDTMAAYRYLPLCLKRFVSPSATFGTEEVVMKMGRKHGNHDFLEAIDLKLRDDNKNMFIVQHIEGLHRYTDTPENETQECLDILTKYFDQLKELGKYDDSFIIVTADHGWHYERDNMPIWYMKRPGETAECIRYCSSPITIADFAATCLDEMGLSEDGDEELFGRPISQIPEDEQRERLVFQRDYFVYVGNIDWKRYSDKDHAGALLGYYYIGTKEDLVRHEAEDPPDIVIETDGYGG